MEHAHDGAVRQAQALGDLPARQLMLSVQPKNIANHAHR